jgi:hypothetical protein
MIDLEPKLGWSVLIYMKFIQIFILYFELHNPETEWYAAFFFSNQIAHQIPKVLSK